MTEATKAMVLAKLRQGLSPRAVADMYGLSIAAVRKYRDLVADLAHITIRPLTPEEIATRAASLPPRPIKRVPAPPQPAPKWPIRAVELFRAGKNCREIAEILDVEVNAVITKIRIYNQNMRSRA